MEPTIIRSGSATTAVNLADEHEDMVHVSTIPPASSTTITKIIAVEEDYHQPASTLTINNDVRQVQAVIITSTNQVVYRHLLLKFLLLQQQERMIR